MNTVPDALFPTDNVYEIPALNRNRAADAVDVPFWTWGSISRRQTMNGTYHFYTDDYRFRALLQDPSPVVATGCITAVEINCTLTDQMPVAVGLYRIYQKRWVSRYWQEQGLRILVDLNVPPKFRQYNLLGVPRGWRAFATRGYTNRMSEILDEHELACSWADTEDLLFVVYGGGRQVQQLAYDRGWVWIPERADVVREMMHA